MDIKVTTQHLQLTTRDGVKPLFQNTINEQTCVLRSSYSFFGKSLTIIFFPKITASVSKNIEIWHEIYLARIKNEQGLNCHDATFAVSISDMDSLRLDIECVVLFIGFAYIHQSGIQPKTLHGDHGRQE